MPKGKTLDQSARVPGTDGEKMSKSYGNTLAVFDDVKKQRKQIMRIQTDSRAMDESKEPEGDILFDLYKLVATPAEIEVMASMYRAGGFGYGDVKKSLAEAAERYWEAPRQRREELAAKPEQVREILAAGAEKARVKARAVLERAQEACGITGW